ncbi:hypothetical protein [Actinomadura sp. CNU-125]|uniref:hypothetical protein n=1 Tax=Actinomadura sp. CNU-125 TaxID=1904961 RepID=UPI00117848AD|nr:hypothetical protein [Actinomadura sp. CNU-125]
MCSGCRSRGQGPRRLAARCRSGVRVLLVSLLEDGAAYGLVFPRTDGRLLVRGGSPPRAAGVDHARLAPHVLRATAATLLDADVPVDRVQTMLGYASPSPRSATTGAITVAYRVSSLFGRCGSGPRRRAPGDSSPTVATPAGGHAQHSPRHLAPRTTGAL